MGAELPIVAASRVVKPRAADEPLLWLANVLIRYASAEQALGTFCRTLDLPSKSGGLDRLAELLVLLAGQTDRECKMLGQRIERWRANRPYRHLLAHSTLRILKDENGQRLVATRHLPRDVNDVTHDRLLTDEERDALLAEVSKDSRSICDLTRNLRSDPALIARLKV